MNELDLKHFKKIKEDDHSAILMHPDGHQVTVAKAPLSLRFREKLSAIPVQHKAEGGEIEKVQNAIDSQPNATLASSGDSVNSQNLPPVIPKGGSTTADSTQKPGFFDSYLDSLNSAGVGVPGSAIPTDKDEQMGRDVRKQGLQNYLSVMTSDNPDREKVTSQINDLNTQSAASPAMQNAQPQAPQNYNLGVNTQVQNAGPNPYLASNSAFEKSYTQGLNNEIAGAQGEAKALGAQGAQEAAAAGKQIEKLQTLQQDYKTHNDALNTEANAVLQDYKSGKINPNQYLENMSTGSKVATALGMLFSGLGGAQENSVTKFLDEQIDRNIKAQQANLDKGNNVLSALFKMQGNLHDATQMYRSIQLDDYAAQLQKIVGQSQNDIQKFKGMQKVGALQRDAAQIRGELALKKTLFQNAGGQNGSPQMDPALMIRGIVPKERQAEAYKELQTQTNIDHINDNAMNAFDKVSKLQTISSRATSPFQSQSQIDAYWNPMVDKITKQNEGRVTPITVDMINALRPALKDNAETLKIKRANLYSLLNGERATPVLDSFQIRLPKNAGAAQPNSNVGAGYNKGRK